MTVQLPRGPVVLEKPRNADDLISEADYVKDERLPYWADLWPSALGLAEYLERSDRVDGRTIELGCGLGLVTIAAMRAGNEVTATDYYEDALLFTARNAHRVTGRTPTVRMVDWRAIPEDLGRFDLVLAADVLYEREYGPLVARTIARVLAPTGRALVADQGRLAIGGFLDECESLGLTSWPAHREHRPTATSPSGETGHTLTIHQVTRA